jgi:hypothetical protein
MSSDAMAGALGLLFFGLSTTIASVVMRRQARDAVF